MSSLEKQCVMCGVNVRGQKRAKDKKGRYYCMPCSHTLPRHGARTSANEEPQSNDVAHEPPSLWCADAILLLARGSLGLYFMLAGMSKFADGGLTGWLEYFNALQPAWLPNLIATPYSVLLPFAEITVGLMAIAGLFTDRVAEAMAFLVATFIIGATGVFVEDLPFHPNILILVLALLIRVTGPGEWSLDEWRKG